MMQLDVTLMQGLAAAAILLGLLLLYSSIVYVPNNRVGVLERLWSTRGSVEQGIVALKGEAGYAPDLLRSGFHVLFPFQYRVHKIDLVVVPQGEIGYVFARDGSRSSRASRSPATRPRPNSRTCARSSRKAARRARSARCCARART